MQHSSLYYRVKDDILFTLHQRGSSISEHLKVLEFTNLQDLVLGIEQLEKRGLLSILDPFTHLDIKTILSSFKEANAKGETRKHSQYYVSLKKDQSLVLIEFSQNFDSERKQYFNFAKVTLFSTSLERLKVMTTTLLGQGFDNEILMDWEHPKEKEEEILPDESGPDLSHVEPHFITKLLCMKEIDYSKAFQLLNLEFQHFDHLGKLTGTDVIDISSNDTKRLTFLRALENVFKKRKVPGIPYYAFSDKKDIIYIENYFRKNYIPSMMIFRQGPMSIREEIIPTQHVLQYEIWGKQDHVKQLHEAVQEVFSGYDTAMVHRYGSNL